MGEITYSVFTKPWPDLSIPELGELVSGLGFQAVEFPVRPGYQVEPEDVTQGLPRLAEGLAEHGVGIASVAGPIDEPTIAACAEAGVPTIRICVSIDREAGYLAEVERLQREYDALVPLLEQYGVQIGIQNHCGYDVPNALGIQHLIGKYDPAHFGAVWDAAHEALAGTEPEFAIDIVWSHLCMVNLKNGFWRRTNGPEAQYAQWKSYWTSGRHGLAVWPRVVDELTRRDYEGVVCLTAEYADHDAVNRLITEDLAFAKGLFGKAEAES
jgi:sugar phosphate isomerase/epimerase